MPEARGCYNSIIQQKKGAGLTVLCLSSDIIGTIGPQQLFRDTIIS